MIYIITQWARDNGFKQLKAKYKPTQKNKPCLEFWKESQFKNQNNNDEVIKNTQNKTKDKKINNTEKETISNNIENGNDPSSSQKTDSKPFVRPVDGNILRRYNPTATKNKNEGIDFYALPGTFVKAAADGVVALISKPVGGSGKIIILKHDKSIMSIYGRVKDLKVSKGSRVTQGQIIGKVENSSDDTSKENYLHFELRKGTKSLDPEPLFR